ncbi:MAG: 50S ribosomal protein L10 [Candidatus Geothermincolia bacterium]
MPSQEKKDKVKQIAKWFDETDTLLVLRYRGLRVAEATEIRQRLKGLDSELRVLKNTLTKIALTDTPKEELAPLIDGPVAVVFVRKDAAAVAKVLKEYSKGRKEFHMLGGWLEGIVLDGKQADAFALLPSREVLLAQLVSAIQAPLARLTGNVAGPLRNMVGLLKAFGDKKAAEAPAPAPEPEARAEAPAVEATAGTEEPAVEATAEAVTVEVEEAAQAEAPGEPAAEAALVETTEESTSTEQETTAADADGEE